MRLAVFSVTILKRKILCGLYVKVGVAWEFDAALCRRPSTVADLDGPADHRDAQPNASTIFLWCLWDLVYLGLSLLGDFGIDIGGYVS